MCIRDRRLVAGRFDAEFDRHVTVARYLRQIIELLEGRAPRQYEALLELVSAGDGERIPTGEVARRLLRACLLYTSRCV